MHRIREQSLKERRVTVVFEDRAFSFILARGATLAELSDRVADLDRRHHGWPVAITVKFSPRTLDLTRSVERQHLGMRQRTDAEKSEHANVEHNTR